MSLAGFPTDPERRGGDEGAGSGEPPADGWNAQFTAIVSGISGSMRWQATPDEMDESALQKDREPPDPPTAVFPSSWLEAEPDNAESRRVRREMRRQERADALAAHLAAQAEFEAEMAADDAHYEPPPPPPIPKPRRRTVVALLAIALGILLVAWPALIPEPFELVLVLGLILILGGLTILVLGMRHRRGESGEGWDDGAEV